MAELIQIFAHEGEGIREVYDNGTWLVSIKNWREANSPEKIARLELHHTTDQQFILISGKACLLLAPTDMDENTEVQVLPLEAGKVYNLPTGTWFNNVLSKDCKLVYCEGSDVVENSEYRPMSSHQIQAVQEKLTQFL